MNVVYKAVYEIKSSKLVKFLDRYELSTAYSRNAIITFRKCIQLLTSFPVVKIKPKHLNHTDLPDPKYSIDGNESK